MDNLTPLPTLFHILGHQFLMEEQYDACFVQVTFAHSILTSDGGLYVIA
jgi:hypothetical protein